MCVEEGRRGPQSKKELLWQKAEQVQRPRRCKACSRKGVLVARRPRGPGEEQCGKRRSKDYMLGHGSPVNDFDLSPMGIGKFLRSFQLAS